MRIWIYGKDPSAVQALTQRKRPADIIIGSSTLPAPGAAFPFSGLTQAMYAALRRELDILLVSGRQLLGEDLYQIQEMEREFERYGVSVRSASSNGKSNS